MFKASEQDIHLPPGITEKDHFLTAAVETLMIQLDDPMLLAIIAGGEDEFMRVAQEKWTGHGFTQPDYQRAFALLRERAHGRFPRADRVNG